MKLKDYLSSIPALHSWDGGKTWNSGGFESRHLQALYDIACRQPSPTIAETGAGNSTICFLLSQPAKLISIAPEAQLFQRIEGYCKTNQIDVSPLCAYVDRSELRLPLLLASETQIDIALIDGCHGWPSVFVDFCYLNAMLKRDGLIIIDDVQLHSVGELNHLLEMESGYELFQDLGKARVFRKLTTEPFLKEWAYQPYIKQRSGA